MNEMLNKDGAAGLSRRGVLGIGAAAALAMVNPALAQTGSKPAGTPRARKGQAVIGFSQEITVLHPLMPANEVDQGVWWNLFSTLWGIDEKGSVLPGPGQAGADPRQWRHLGRRPVLARGASRRRQMA